MKLLRNVSSWCGGGVAALDSSHTKTYNRQLVKCCHVDCFVIDYLAVLMYFCLAKVEKFPSANCEPVTSIYGYSQLLEFAILQKIPLLSPICILLSAY